MEYETKKDTKYLPKHILKDGAKWLMIPSKIVGESLTLWPEHYNKAISVLHCFYLFSYLFFLFGDFYFVLGPDATLTTITITLTFVDIGVESSVRLILSRIYRKRLKRLLHMIYYEFWPSNIAGDEMHKGLARESRYLFIYCVTYISAAVINVMQYISQPLMSGGVPLGTMYPFQKKSPYYELLYIWESFIVMVMPFAVCGYDLPVMSIWYNVIAQFKLLRAYMKQEFQKALLKEDYNTEAKKVLYLCIRRHNELIEICKEINNIYTYFVLFQVLISIGNFCLSMFIGSVFPEELGTAFPYFFGHACIIFTYCYMGNELVIESTALSDAAYECGWNLAPTDRDIQKALVMMMVRAQRPLFVSTGGFGVLGLTTFMKLLQFSFSVYTLLNSMMAKQNGIVK